MALAKLNTSQKWQMDVARKLVDPDLAALIEEFDAAYYGTAILDGQGNPVGRQADGWKHDVSHPVRGFDKEATLVASADKHRLLCGILHSITPCAQHCLNIDQGSDKYPEVKYNQILDNTGALVETCVRRAKREARALWSEYNAQGYLPALNAARKTALLNIIKAFPAIQAMRTRRQSDVDTVLDFDVNTDLT